MTHRVEFPPFFCRIGFYLTHLSHFMVHIWIIYFVFRCVSLRYGSDVAIGIKQNCFHRFIQNESISHLGSDTNVLRIGPIVYEPSILWGKFVKKNVVITIHVDKILANRTREQSWAEELRKENCPRMSRRILPTYDTLFKNLTEIRTHQKFISGWYFTSLGMDSTSIIHDLHLRLSRFHHYL